MSYNITCTNCGYVDINKKLMTSYDSCNNCGIQYGSSAVSNQASIHDNNTNLEKVIEATIPGTETLVTQEAFKQAQDYVDNLNPVDHDDDDFDDDLQIEDSEIDVNSSNEPFRYVSDWIDPHTGKKIGEFHYNNDVPVKDFNFISDLVGYISRSYYERVLRMKVADGRDAMVDLERLIEFTVKEILKKERKG